MEAVTSVVRKGLSKELSKPGKGNHAEGTAGAKARRQERPG